MWETLHIGKSMQSHAADEQPGAAYAMSHGRSLPSLRPVPLAAPGPQDAATSLTIVHVEGRTPFRRAVRAAAEPFRHVRYLAKDSERTISGPVLLVVNLLVLGSDPLAAVAYLARHTGDAPRVFAYCAEGANGLVMGVTEVFPHPFDPAACAMRLRARPGGLQRLLVVSEAVETAGVMRDVLSRAQTATAVAVDRRQALELLPSVDPDFVLIDLALPHGGALGLVNRLKSNRQTAALALGLFCSTPLDANEFRSHMHLITRGMRFSVAGLAHAVTNVLADSVPRADG